MISTMTLPTLSPSEKSCIEVKLYKIHNNHQIVSLSQSNKEETASTTTNEETEINYWYDCGSASI